MGAVRNGKKLFNARKTGDCGRLYDSSSRRTDHSAELHDSESSTSLDKKKTFSYPEPAAFEYSQTQVERIQVRVRGRVALGTRETIFAEASSTGVHSFCFPFCGSANLHREKMQMFYKK